VIETLGEAEIEIEFDVDAEEDIEGD